MNEFLKTCMYFSGHPDTELVMMNDYARQHLEPADQAIALARSAGVMETRYGRPDAQK